MKICAWKAFSVATLSLTAINADASNHVLTFSGAVGNGYVYSYDVGAIHYDAWSLLLDGLSSSNGFEVSQGDTVSAVIRFDQALNVPSAKMINWYQLILAGVDFPATSIATEGTVTVKLGGTTISSESNNCATIYQIANCWVRVAPNNAAASFDEISLDFSIKTLSTPVTVNQGTFTYLLMSPAMVPEPMTVSLMIAGLGLLAFRRRT